MLQAKLALLKTYKEPVEKKLIKGTASIKFNIKSWFDLKKNIRCLKSNINEGTESPKLVALYTGMKQDSKVLKQIVSIRSSVNQEDLLNLDQATLKLNDMVRRDFECDTPLEITRYLSGELFFLTVAVL